MQYRYVAYGQGKMVRGKLEGSSALQIEEVLAQQGFRLLKLKPALHLPRLEEAFPSFFQPKKSEVILFTRQLATLQECGVGLVPALNILRSQARNRSLKKVLSELLEALSRGEPFSAGVAKYPRVFNQLYCKMVAVGEKSGQLEQALRQVAAYMERQSLMMKKVAKAMTYPALVMLLAVGVVGVLLTVALPPMVGVFETFGAKLPAPTRALLFLTRVTTTYRLQIFLGMVVLGLLAAWFLGQPLGRRVKDRALLKIPLIGGVILTGEVARFSRIVSMLLRAGVSMPDTMELVCDTSTNVVVKDSLGKVQKDLLQGRGLSAPLARTKLFPPLFVQMVIIGEETATLEATLSNVADAYDGEVEEKIGVMMTFLEPAMTLMIAMVVGFIAISMITPMYSILGSLK